MPSPNASASGRVQRSPNHSGAPTSKTSTAPWIAVHIHGGRWLARNQLTAVWYESWSWVQSTKGCSSQSPLALAIPDAK